MKKQAKPPKALTCSTMKYSFSNEKFKVHIVRKAVFVEREIASTQFHGSAKYPNPSCHIDFTSREPKQIMSEVDMDTRGYALA